MSLLQCSTSQHCSSMPNDLVTNPYLLISSRSNLETSTWQIIDISPKFPQAGIVSIFREYVELRSEKKHRRTNKFLLRFIFKHLFLYFILPLTLPCYYRTTWLCILYKYTTNNGKSNNSRKGTRKGNRLSKEDKQAIDRMERHRAERNKNILETAATLSAKDHGGRKTRC
jgi:hypothetical protein